LERGESFAGTACEWDNTLALVELERLPVGAGGLLESPGGLEHDTQIEDRVAVARRRVGCLHDGHRVARETFCVVVLASVGPDQCGGLSPECLLDRIVLVAEISSLRGE
jgi:hypothetical protein